MSPITTIRGGWRRSLHRLFSLAHRNVDATPVRAKYFPFLDAVSKGAGLPSKDGSRVLSSGVNDNTGKVNLAGARPLTLAEASASIVLPLSREEELRNSYVSYLGDVRLGKVLEDCDAIAGGSGYEFVGHGRGLGAEDLLPDRGGVTIVTASVDQMTVHCRPKITDDLRYTSGVEWVGRSSMSVAVNVETRTGNAENVVEDEAPGNRAGSPAQGEWSPVLCSRFTMVALDESTGRPIEVNKLSPSGPEEKERHAAAARAVEVQRRLTKNLREAVDTPPSPEELLLIHRLVKRHEKEPHATDLRTISSTRLESTVIMHPQQRNVHGKVFGGFLMRSGYELAFATAAFFTHSTPLLVAVEDIHFIAPVDIGCAVRFSASVDFAAAPLFAVSVAADVVDPRTSETVRTTTFLFTFAAKEVPEVVPVTYTEAIANVAARRVLYRSSGDVDEFGPMIEGL